MIPATYVVGMAHVDVVIAWDFHKLEPLEKGGDTW